jgi:hypothetical protein
MLRSATAANAIGQKGDSCMELIQLGWFLPFRPERDGEGPSRYTNPLTALRAKKPRLFKA